MNNNKSTLTALAVTMLIVAGGVGIFFATKDKKADVKTVTTPVAQVPVAKPVEKPAPTADVVGLAIATPDLSTLVSAVKAADLVTTLQGAGPFTVFAPLNSGFAALPSGTLDSLLLPENKAKLASILTYHVVAGKVLSKDLSNGQVIGTVAGGKLTVEIANGKVMLVDEKGGKSTVKTADVEAKNGVVHVIDSVLLSK
jgi:uncharacterized surface protein with fasciclin (FAS1) repeats